MFKAMHKLNSAEQADIWIKTRLNRGIKEGPFSEFGTLTPELATLLLANNPDNRDIVPAALAGFMADIRNGKFATNGESIIVAVSGEINDGQHRCEAVKQTGIAVDTVFVFGVERDSRTTVDQGARKTPAHVAKMAGWTYAPSASAAVAASLWQVDHYGEIPGRRDPKGKRIKNAVPQPTRQERVDYLFQKAGEIEHALRVVSEKASRNVAHRSTLALVHIMISRKCAYPDHVDYFFDHICSGAEMSKNDPILAARDRLQEERRKDALTAFKTVEILLRAWNFRRDGLSRGKFTFLLGTWPEILP